MNEAGKEERKKGIFGISFLLFNFLLWGLSAILAVIIFSNQYNILHDYLDIEDIYIHLRKFEEIANATGSRAVTTGYNDSWNYVYNELDKTKYFDLKPQYFTIRYWQRTDTPRFEMNSPYQIKFDYEEDFDTFQFSITKTVISSPLIYVGQGCTDEDFSQFQPNHIALIKRGGCTFVNMTSLALKYNASGAVIFNNVPGLFIGSAVDNNTIPVFSTTMLVGELLSRTKNVTVTLASFGEIKETTTINLIAETREGRSDRIIVIGSHLDSVTAGAGINDNGSGSATNLAIALLFSKLKYKPENKVRFAWWGAEELGLLGSQYYMDDIYNNHKDEYLKIALNLNFDMLGSPNYHFGIYNASSGDEVKDIVNGSIIIQKQFEEFFILRQLPFMLVPFTGRSDYGPFIRHGIPAGGASTGADEVKSLDERIVFGGYAKTTSDPCYHQKCDTVANINKYALDIMSHAAAYVLGKLASDVKLVDQIYHSNNRTAILDRKKFNYYSTNK